MRRFRLDWKNVAIGAVGTMALCVIPVNGDTLSSVIVGIRKKIGGRRKNPPTRNELAFDKFFICLFLYFNYIET